MRIWWYFGGRIAFSALIMLMTVALYYYIRALQIRLGGKSWGPTATQLSFFFIVALAHLTFVPLQWAKLVAKEELRNGKSALNKVPPIARRHGAAAPEGPCLTSRARRARPVLC